MNEGDSEAAYTVCPGLELVSENMFISFLSSLLSSLSLSPIRIVFCNCNGGPVINFILLSG